MTSQPIPLLYAAFIQRHLPGVDVAAIRLRTGTWQAWLFGLLGQWAVTWDGQIHLTPKLLAEPWWMRDEAQTASLLAHESLHVKQQLKYGWWPFLGLYVWHRLSHPKEPINRHPLEQPCYELGANVYAAWVAEHGVSA